MRRRGARGAGPARLVRLTHSHANAAALYAGSGLTPETETWLDGVRTVSVTSGASVPESLVQEVLAFLREEGVDPATAASVGPEKGAAEVGDIANPSTVILRCYH